MCIPSAFVCASLGIVPTVRHAERGGDGDRALLPFKLHRFISGAGHVYATLRGSGQRLVTLDGQRFDVGIGKTIEANVTVAGPIPAARAGF